MTLTTERLKEVLEYDPENGKFYWNKPGKGHTMGNVAGNLLPSGYVQLCIDYTKYYAHRVAWFYTTGAWPLNEIDHLDGNRSNNRFSNLRESSSSLNKENRHIASSKSKTGLLGVEVNNYGYAARIRVKGRRIGLGNFSTPEEAHEAYIKAKRKLHEGCTI